ncbi:transposase [Stenotrophomonas sp.]|uniref:transposase n=1 Tax=Stenotrophomonas sp. TaxID=69392 RepID=UPI0028AB68BC|nr:transposase [Stenotrophomonas sp.]
MARQPRIDLAGIAQHVIQRGNDRQPCFFRDIDRTRYLQDLRELSIKFGCGLHAYVLMTNHVHLLITPTEAGAISHMMQSLGRRYVRYVNDAYTRTGTLWEGRYKSHLVASDEHLLRCYRYIELNPVRARMVARPEDYAWSSYRHNALGMPDPALQAHVCYQRLGPTLQQRQMAYKVLVDEINAEDAEQFRTHLHKQQPMGNDRFRASIEQQLGRSLSPRKSGRPKTRL